MSLSNTIRRKLAEKIGPCPTCGHQKMTVTALAEQIGQSDSSVGRFLNGGSPSVALLDAADAYLWKEIPQDEAGASAFLPAAQWEKGWTEMGLVAAQITTVEGVAIDGNVTTT